MIDFNSALERKINALKLFVSSEVNTAADIGCGSGIDSIALASLGLEVSGFDSSHLMIEKAMQNAREENKNAKFFNHTAQEIPESFNSNFDFICSLGNTVANISHDDIAVTIKRFSDLLNQNGKLLFHILNYERILRVNERIVNIGKDENDCIVRFYDFEKDHINFNILKFEIDNPKSRKLISTKVYPHSLKLFLDLLKQNGFKIIEVFGDLRKNAFNSETSNDIYLFAEK
jgi:SAM-dependent methyltransferase